MSKDNKQTISKEKSSITGATGHGSAILPFSVAKVLIDEGNRNFPELKHWFVVSR